MKYHWSHYNIYEKFENFHIIYNTKTSAVIKINNNIYSEIQSFIKSSTINDFDDECIKMLVKEGFLITSNTNEFSAIKKRYLNKFY